jgi:hypothetical protein
VTSDQHINRETSGSSDCDAATTMGTRRDFRHRDRTLSSSTELAWEAYWLAIHSRRGITQSKAPLVRAGLSIWAATATTIRQT